MNNKLIFLILFLAAFLRFYKLNSFPPSLYWDEVAIGYNAYSISQTAKDEYGTRLPLLFKSFNDFKLPGYIYLDSLAVKLFGLSEYTVRLPSAILGTIAVLGVYLLVRKLIDLKTAIISSLLLTISPWHLQFSRAAFEANIALTIIISAIALIFFGFKNRLAALLSIPLLSISIYFYNGVKIFTPLIFLVTFLIFKKEILKNRKYFLFGLIIALLIVIPFAQKTLSYEGIKRFKEVSVFEDQSLIVDYIQARANNASFTKTIFLNRRIPQVFTVLKNYASHFSLGFLFFGDDPNPRHKSAFHGNFFLLEIPLMILGLWQLIISKDKKLKYFIFTWLVLAPLPAAITAQAPHSLRALQLLPPLIIITALGITKFAKNLLPISVIVILYTFFFASYLYSYYVVYPQKDDLAWAYGYKQMYQEISKLEGNYDRVIVTGYYWKPYIFYLFYNQIDPQVMQTSANQESIGKFKFGTTGWDSGGKDLDEEDIEQLKGAKTLLALSPQEFETIKNSNKFKRLATINDYSQNKKVFMIGEWQ